MAIILSAANGNWSNAASWVGGIVPGNGDSAVINHAITMDVDTIIGPSAPAFSTNGLNNFAVVVNAASPYGVAWHNTGTNLYMTNGNSGSKLVIAAGVKGTFRGDVVLNGAPLNLMASSTYMFDSSQAASPASQSYVLEIINSYGTAAGVLQAFGVPGNRAVITSNVAGGGAVGRITSGEKVLGYAPNDSGLLNLSYVKMSYVGDASRKCASYRIGGPSNGTLVYAYYVDHVAFNYCGRFDYNTAYIAPAVDYTFTNNTFTNSTDTARASSGYGVVSTGANIYLNFTASSTRTRKINGNVFDLQPQLFGFAGAGAQLNRNVFKCQFQLDQYCFPLQMYYNTIYVPQGYAGGGGLNLPWGIDFQNNYHIQDSSLNVNSHFLQINYGTGVTTLKWNIFELSQSAAGYYGGNCFIMYPASSGTLSSNVAAIKNNIVLPANDSTSAANATGRANFGKYLAAGTLVTVLQGLSTQNFTMDIQNNTSAIPHGIGSIDPDENAAGAVGIFTAVRSNIFWMDYTASLTSPGYAVWWNTNSHARAPTVDEGISTNYTNNCFLNVKGGTGVYLGVTSGSTVFDPTKFVATPGYSDGFFSSTTAPGANDVAADPQLNDPNRNTWTFDTAQGGAGTTTNVLAQFSLQNDDTGFNAAYTIDNLLAHVRAGMTPTNLTIKGAGYGGSDPGAVPILAPLAWSTAAGPIGSGAPLAAFSATVGFSDPNAGYSASVSSTAGLPAGLVMNPSTGVISGNLPSVSVTTVYSFTVNITDGVLVSSRVFSITVVVSKGRNKISMFKPRLNGYLQLG